MQIFEKELADTDSIYCAKPTNSHQSSIFIGPTDGPASCGLFGADYVSDMDVVIELSMDNLLLNVLYHFLSGTKYKKRGSNLDWEFDKNWLLEKRLAVQKVFKGKGATARFHTSINKETTRTYLKGIAGAKVEGGTERIDVRDYIFSGDVLRMCRKEDGSVAVIIADRGGDEILFAQKKIKMTLKNDRLSVALKVFKERRESWADAHGKSGYEFVNANVRKQYDGCKNWDAEAMADAETFKKFCIEQTWMLQNGKGSYKCISEYSDDERKRLIAWIDAKIVKLTAPLAEVIVEDNGFKGVTNKAVTELLMKFHPDQFCLCNGPTLEVLKYLEVDPATDEVRDYDTYLQVMGCCAKILARLRQMEIGATLDGAAPADYLTVNEFIYFVHENKDLIKEEVMSKEFKKVEKKPKSGNKKLGDMMQDPLMLRLAAALRTKPFAILAGHSGTGKSQMVRRLAYMTCADEGLMAEANEGNAPGNYCMIQVKPNWHDSTDLLGYYSEIGKKYRTTDFVRFVMKAYAYPEVPFFVCLDEMNLAPVEQYFAEYLSALESASDKSGVRLTDPLLPKDYAADEVADGENCRFTESKAWFDAHGLTLPRNLFVVGTVNMDDTTCQFSRKVLDRAMTIMMDRVKFEDMMDKEKSVEPSTSDLLVASDIAKFLDGKLRADPLTTHQVTLLNSIESVLGKTPFAVAYRFANEYALYETSLVALTGKADDEALAKEAIDHCVLMKVLPRIQGERKELKKLFQGDDGVGGLEATFDKDTSLSFKKMEEILERKQSYLSFWP